MCGRFSVSLPPEKVARCFKISGPLPNSPPRYNMAPTQLAPVVRFNTETNARQLDLLRWGLIPSSKSARSVSMRARSPWPPSPRLNRRSLGTALYRAHEWLLRVEEDGCGQAAHVYHAQIGRRRWAWLACGRTGRTRKAMTSEIYLPGDARDCVVPAAREMRLGAYRRSFS